MTNVSAAGRAAEARLETLLALWRGRGAAPLARAHFAAMTADLPPNPTPADWRAALWLPADDTPAGLLTDLDAWYHDPATSAALTGV
ncbi:MAG: hypothetical protein Q4D96_11420 [Propionibacteriaceae bacterium]|nr:hypothetical protein [Propionibacteriaceae bacterium]